MEVWRLSAPLMIQDDSVKCSDGMRNKPALLQYALGEGRPSLKHKAYQLYRLNDFNTGHCCILFPVPRCITLNKREQLSVKASCRWRAHTNLQLKACKLPAMTGNRWSEDGVTRDILMKVAGALWNMNTFSVCFFDAGNSPPLIHKHHEVLW